ncbi:MAG: hypothetical protein HY673_23795 [Chloroflexi bacterium]|nr:hypothetical protein [Chloroflexota bacterium]
MAQENQPEITLLDETRMLLSTVLAGIMGFLKGRDIPVRNWVSYMGGKLEDSLGGLEGKGADLAMRQLLVLQILPAGGQVVIGVLTPERAEVTVTSLPSTGALKKFGATPRELLATFGVTPKDFESIYSLYEPAMAAIGLHLTHRRAGDRVVLSLAQASESNAPPSPAALDNQAIPHHSYA